MASFFLGLCCPLRGSSFDPHEKVSLVSASSSGQHVGYFRPFGDDWKLSACSGGRDLQPGPPWHRADHSDTAVLGATLADWGIITYCGKWWRTVDYSDLLQEPQVMTIYWVMLSYLLCNILLWVADLLMTVTYGSGSALLSDGDFCGSKTQLFAIRNDYILL